MSQVATVADWAPPITVSLITRAASIIRSTYVMLVVDNPLSWKFGFRGQNEQDDIEGPFYIPGAPSRQIEDGKAVLACKEYIEKFGPFLFVFYIKDVKGDPIPNATVNWWQADCDGGYYFAKWTLRGTVTTDAQGRIEVLTIRPGDYGAPFMGKRSGHIHLVISGTKGKHRHMTTQAYVCPANKTTHMLQDLANYARIPRPVNMATCWSITAANGGEQYWELPELPAEDTDAAKSVSWWNAKLKERGIDREVLAVGRHEVRVSLL
ncbi:Intradiol ring-cleavage dioxygenase [Lenzites betulinus]|nr:Intradiol ring-cleavage dioxygenase [Lenzites betulinus]